ncbi:tyrosine-type recombinase/integrase [Nocardioides psychrotolerans]|uniref:tyrosine-type recombinase/integrase n=1 Tax=Nocardioides psychrotolerans TaxID=1005945 RepID=UPI001C3F7B12|nr:site-specific integrase [Nocardioides psychrotolerans]
MTVLTLPDRRMEARTRFRDLDGKSRLVSARGQSRSAAEIALKRRLSERNVYQPVDTSLTLDSPFGELVDYWLADLDPEARIAPSTRRFYEDAIRHEVLPALEHLTLREIGVARCDALLKRLGQLSYARSKRAKTVLRLAFGLAVRHEVMPRNPIDGVSRMHKPKRSPTALAAVAVNAIRAVIKAWEHQRGSSGPNPDGQLGQIVEVMLGTSARIGEVLGIRRCDLDLTTTPATLRICGTVISQKGVGTFRQAHPKTDRSNRVVALPTFTAEALRRRLAVSGDRSFDALVFASREGTPLTTANVRRQLRTVLERAGITGVTPHMFRRTVATVINEAASVDLAAQLLGHTDPKVTIEHYIRRNEHVNPLTAELLDQAFAQEDESKSS